MDRVEMVDSHIHILPPWRTRGLVRWARRIFPDHPYPEEITPDELLDDLRECGVSSFFNLVFPLAEEETGPLNEWSAQVASRPDVTGFGSLHVETPRKDEVTERCVAELGLAGMKLHPYVQLFEAFSPEFEPMFRKLDEMGRPFVVHTGFDIFYRRTQDLAFLRKILERYDRMPVVLVHSLFPRFALARRLMEEYPLLYLDATNAVSATRWYEEAPGNWADALGDEPMEENMEHFRPLLLDFSDRIMFGTDHPAGMGCPVGRLFEDLRSLGLPDGAESNLLGGTALRFLADHCGSLR